MAFQMSLSEVSATISKFDVLVVGAGLFGLSIAERASTVLGKRVLVVDRRPHVGGNAFSQIDAETGIEVHLYGPHIFHTSNEKVWQYVTQFTEFNSYRHHVWSRVGDDVFPLPVSLATISKIEGKFLSPAEAHDWLERERLPSDSPQNFEEKALSAIGPKLYEMFFRGYTAKQWETDPKLLPKEIFGRLPIRFDFNTRYFNDKYEGIPLRGYTAWMNEMVSSNLIGIGLSIDFKEIKDQIPKQMPVVYTGPLDEYFDHKFGNLSWRTLDFEFETLDTGDFQGTSQINFPSEDVPFTRTVEYRHFHPEWKQVSAGKSVISREYSRKAVEGDEPFYPINSLEDRARLHRYREAAGRESNVYFGGRLGTYQYLDMHMAIASALTLFENELAGYL